MPLNIGVTSLVSSDSAVFRDSEAFAAIGPNAEVRVARVMHLVRVMSKHNVNPNHYKVAGRERQGEDILQARHKAKLAESRARERFEPRQMNRALAGAVPSAPVPASPPPGPSAVSAAATAPAKHTARKKTAAARKTSTEAGPKAKKAGAKKAARPAAPKAGAKASGTRGTRSTAKKRASSRTERGKTGSATRRSSR